MALNPKNFGLAGGILLSLTLFGVAWHAILTDLGNKFMIIWEDMHFWYEFVPLASPEGSLVALADGFVHGFVYLFILIWLYNLIENKTSKKD